jgi:hypothetical protein
MNTVRLEVRRDVGDCAVLRYGPTCCVGLKVEKYGITIVQSYCRVPRREQDLFSRASWSNR